MSSCIGQVPKGEINPLGKREATATHDLAHIQESGVLIAAMLSGPETYYEHRGQSMGLQYTLVEHFALTQGVEVRVELAHDTTELVNLLVSQKADLIAIPLPDSVIALHEVIAVAAQRGKGAWIVRTNEPQLAEALHTWYTDSLLATAERTSATRHSSKSYIRRQIHAPAIALNAGVISPYDHLFKQGAVRLGWDWRLIAALCYQESAFDPNAESWAGARGLMQIMPATAAMLGLSQANIYQPEASVEAGTRYLGQLYQQFSDINNPTERIKFAIAAYNGGHGHVRDAMALARKYGNNATTWDAVSPYILALSEPQYYRDPIVRHGYMRGSETHDYVYNIMKRWKQYGGQIAIGHASGMPRHHFNTSSSSVTPRQRYKRNRFTTTSTILQPDNPNFGKRVTSTAD